MMLKSNCALATISTAAWAAFLDVSTTGGIHAATSALRSCLPDERSDEEPIEESGRDRDRRERHP